MKKELQSKDFRIGNYYNFEDTTGLILEQVEYIDTHCVDVNPFDLIKPIKITNDWLLDFGFEKIDYYKFRLIFQGSYIELKNVDESEGEPYTKDGNITDWVCFYGLEDDESTTLCYPNYIHELQNLYFALTGEELELKSDNP